MKIEVLINEEVVGLVQDVELKEWTPEKGANNLGISRMRLKKEKLVDLFAREYVHAAAQKYPFQISVKQDDKELLKINNIWIWGNQPLTIFDVDGWVLIENFSCVYENIMGMFSNGNI